MKERAHVTSVTFQRMQDSEGSCQSSRSYNSKIILSAIWLVQYSKIVTIP